MQVYAKTNKKLFVKATAHGWDIVRTPSQSNPDKYYTVDMTHGRCSCPAWIFQKGGERHPCKHLRKLGFNRVVPVYEVAELPKITKAQKEAAPIVETY